MPLSTNPMEENCPHTNLLTVENVKYQSVLKIMCNSITQVNATAF